MTSTRDTDHHEIEVLAQKVASMRVLIDAPSEETAEQGGKAEALKAELTAKANACAVATGWTRDEFLEHAGCSSAQQVIDGSAKIDFMLACLSYLLWIEEFLGELDLVFDRQAAVLASTRLFREGGRDLNDCKRAMVEKLAPSDLCANELILLGEVTKGFQVALGHTESRPGRTVKRVLLDDPRYLESPHVGEERVRLAWDDPAVLGLNVARRIQKHVRKCSVCPPSPADTP